MNVGSKIGLGVGAFVGILILSAAVFALIVAPIIMVGAALLHWIIPAVPAIGYLTSLAIAGVLWAVAAVKRLVFG